MTDPQPFTLAPGPEAKRHAPATARNRDVLVDALKTVLPNAGTVLEIASGTGEHVVHFARHFPKLVWQPSDADALGLASIAAWSVEAALPNVLPPLLLDASTPDWPVTQADAVLCINMVHIAPWAATLGLMAGAAHCLPSNGRLILYGPFLREGVETAPSNLAFDTNLKAQNPAWGLRTLEDVAGVAAGHGFMLEQVIDMPANNLTVIFRRG
jgi:hypothetical protein